MRGSGTLPLLILVIACSMSGRLCLAAETVSSEAARQQLQQLSRQLFTSPENVDLYIRRGDLYFQLHDFDKAADDYSAALRLDKNRAEAYFGRGLALGRIGRVREGIADLTLFLQHRPDSSLGYTKRGVRYLWLGERDKAEQDLRKAISLEPRNAEAHDDLGVIHAQRGELDTAIEHFNKTIRFDPSYQKGYHNLALVHYLAGEFNIALNHVDRAIRLLPNSRNSLLLKAEILTALNRNDEALVIREEAEFLPEGNWSEEAPTP